MPTLCVLPTRRHLDRLATTSRPADTGIRADSGFATLDELALAICGEHPPAEGAAELRAVYERWACGQVLREDDPKHRWLVRALGEATAAGLEPEAIAHESRLAHLAAALRHLAPHATAIEPLLRRAARHLAAGAPLPAMLRRFDRIELASHVAWSSDALAFVRALAAAGVQVAVRMPCVERGDGALALDPDWSALETHGGELELVSEEAVPRQRPRLVELADSAQETRFVAETVASWLASGVAADEIAIATPRRGAALAFALVVRGIPVIDATPHALAEARSVRLALQLAQPRAALEMSREWLLGLIESSFVDLRGLRAHPPSPALVARIVRASGVRTCALDGPDGLDARLQRLARSQRRDRVAEPDVVLAARDLVRDLVQRLQSLPRTATMAEHARALRALLLDLGIDQRVRELDGAPGVEARSADAEKRAWMHFTQALDRIARMGAPVAAWRCGRAVFSDVLHTVTHVRDRQDSLPPGAITTVPWSQVIGGGWKRALVVAGEDDSAPRGWLEERLPRAHGRSPDEAERALDPASIATVLSAGGAEVVVATHRDRSEAIAGGIEALARQLGTSAERVPHTPLDPRLARRDSPSIAVRQLITRERIAAFAGARSPGPHSGHHAAAAARIRKLAPGSAEWPLSPSALERLANCGFQHGADWLWRARIAEVPEDELDVLELGRLAHLTAEVAVDAICDVDLWRVDKLPQALAAALRAAEGALDRAEAESVLGHGSIWRLTRRRMLAQLRVMLSREISLASETALRPIATELSFGLPNAPLPTLPIGGVHVGGRIDRVDAGGGRLHVIDYKSGRTSSNARRMSSDGLLETDLQLPLYVAAMRKLMPDARGAEVDAVLVSLRDGERTRGLFESLPERSFDVMEKALAARIEGLAEQLRAGMLAAAPHSCAGCALRPVCRIPVPKGVR